MTKYKTTPTTEVDCVVLLPCPFCGGKATWIERLHSSGRIAGYDIACDGYECMAADGFDWVMDKASLAKMWNRRAGKASIRAEAERLGIQPHEPLEGLLGQ